MSTAAPALHCLHADDALLVFDKPAGLPAVPGRPAHLHDCLASRAQANWPDALVVHRLDMATSGLIAMARGAEAQRRLSAAFAGRQVHKRYVALAEGRIEAPQGWHEIDLPLLADWPQRPKQKVDHGAGKPSLTRYRVLGHEAGATRVELEPVTGRSHQLRVHLLALGHPILGDTLYAPPQVQARSERLCLHACELRLAHPFSGEPLVFRSATPF